MMASYQISVVNDTTQATPTNFQQLIQTTLQYPSGVRFWSPIDGWLYGWLESLSSTNQANIWVKIPSSIPAGGVYQIYMVESSSLNFDGNYWGEAPTLSSSYGQYDNGGNVFNNYWNFAGTSMPSGFTEYADTGATVTVNNSLQLNLSSGNACTSPRYLSFVYNSAINAAETIVETYSSGTRGPGPTDLGIYTANSGTAGGYAGVADTWGWGYGAIELGYANLGNPFDISSGSGIASIYWVGEGNEGVGWNYSFVSSTNTSETWSNSLYMAIGTVTCTGGSNMTYYWLRTRDYPPNGVMPAVSIVPVQAWEVFMPPLP